MKTFFVDIDGVIYKNGKVNKDVIDLIDNSDNRLVFCTGRGYTRCLDIVGDFLKKDSILIVENGSKIVDYTGNIIYSKNISSKTKEVLKDIDYNQIESIIYNSNDSNNYISFSKTPLKHIVKNYNKFLDFYDEMLHQHFTQITVKFENDIYKNYFVDYLNLKNINVKKSEDYTIINEKNVSKKSGINEYIKKYKIEVSDTIVIGNDYNDIEMFKMNCGHKIAVKDEYTPESLLELATDITDFNNLSKTVSIIIKK